MAGCRLIPKDDEATFLTTKQSVCSCLKIHR